MQRAAGENQTVLGAVGELDAFGRSREDHAVLADHGAAAQRRKADIARLARAGHAVAAALGALGEIDAAAFGCGAAEQQRGAGRRVYLFVVVHLEDLDVVIFVERRRHALDQSREQIDAETHIAGFYDRRALARLRNHRFLLGGMAGGADDVHETGGRGQLGEGKRRGGDGELDQAVGLLEQWRHVARHLDAVQPEAGKLAGIAAEPGASTAPASVKPLVAAMAWIIVRPMRPPAPAITTRMSDMGFVSRRGGYSRFSSP